MSPATKIELPGLNCGLCGYRKCDELAEHMKENPELARRCIHLSGETMGRSSAETAQSCSAPPRDSVRCSACASGHPAPVVSAPWTDSLGREFDFYLEHFPEEPGPREIILPHNPMVTRELDVQVGDTLIGRPLGMSCGCPITHCGVVVAVDQRTGVMSWCVTGPLGPRQHGYKDLGYYIAEGYEGMVYESRAELRIGMRHYFQPRMCMLQWRHSGLINYLNRLENGWQIRLEGLFIG